MGNGGTGPPLEVEQCPPLEVAGVLDGRIVGVMVCKKGTWAARVERGRVD